METTIKRIINEEIEMPEKEKKGFGDFFLQYQYILRECWNKEEQLEDKQIQIYARNWEEKHLDRLKDEDRLVVEKRIKEKQKRTIDKVKEQVIPYEILEKAGTTYKLSKGDDENRR